MNTASVASLGAISRLREDEPDRALERYHERRAKEPWYAVFVKDVASGSNSTEIKTGLDALVRSADGIPSQVYENIIFFRAPHSQKLRQQVFAYLLKAGVSQSKIEERNGNYFTFVSREYFRDEIKKMH